MFIIIKEVHHEKSKPSVLLLFMLFNFVSLLFRAASLQLIVSIEETVILSYLPPTGEGETGRLLSPPTSCYLLQLVGAACSPSALEGGPTAGRPGGGGRHGAVRSGEGDGSWVGTAAGEWTTTTPVNRGGGRKGLRERLGSDRS